MVVVMKTGGHRLHSCIIYADGLAFDLKEAYSLVATPHIAFIGVSVDRFVYVMRHYIGIDKVDFCIWIGIKI